MRVKQDSLNSTSVPQLLAEAWRDRRSGCLRVARGKNERLIHIDDGSPTGLETSLADDHFAQLLERTRSLTRAERLRVEKLAEQSECSQASSVLALGLLDPGALYLAMREATRAQITEVFDWPEGEHSWTPPTPNAKSAGSPFDILQLLQEELPRRWGSEILFEALMAHSDQVGNIPPRFRRVADKLGAQDPIPRRLIQGLDGSTSIGLLLAECAGHPLAASTLWVLLHAGLLKLSDGSTRVPAPPVEIEVIVDSKPESSSRATVGTAAAATSANVAARANEKATALRAEINSLLSELNEISHYDSLGLAADAGPAEIKKAYFKAAKKYHPDSLARMGLNDIREDAARVFARIAEAYEVLSDSKRRARYDSGADDAEHIDTARLAQAETAYRKGEILVKMGKMADALDYLEPAVEHWPEEPVYQALLGWALFKQPQSNPVRAREHLSIADGQQPNNALTLFRLGLVLRSLRENDTAEKLIARARRLDPDIAD